MDMKWTGTLPDIEAWDFTDAMKDCARYMWQSVMENFDSGGRPQSWVAKKNGEPSYLFKSGHLRSSIDYESTKDSFKVFVDKGTVPYCFAHQFGYMQRNLKARPYMVFQEEDREFLQSMFAEAVVKLFDTKRRPVGTQG
jgi:phage gpG-like protein